MKTQTNTPIYWTLLSHEDWTLPIAATTAGLCYVGSPHAPATELTDWAHARYPGRRLMEDDEHLAPYRQELIEYLEGTRRAFTLPFDVQGTPFQQDVWKALCGIPYGETTSYSAIAAQIQRPKAVRAVGTAIGANPVLMTIPCHRVIGKGGALTGYRGGITMKTRLLELERLASGTRGEGIPYGNL
ncbi:methylated-DNA--[protein]-cysteine S-methyltransferase [Gorillibacterium sp. CAU 1737]|uniref:methylated-DNA--[protein]-cysteine S-methyltransferase n=1 Tax=Gorillibacterium sp. CAU 1737 TaxID=3140362 RepID=UPI00325FF302